MGCETQKAREGKEKPKSQETPKLYDKEAKRVNDESGAIQQIDSSDYMSPNDLAVIQPNKRIRDHDSRISEEMATLRA